MESTITISCSLLLFLCFSVAFAREGLTVDLMHRDSIFSPFYNPSTTKWTRLSDMVQRSISRFNYFKECTDDAQSPVLPAGGEFLMKIAIGTPPAPFLAIVDTGSDLTWTQCKPCSQCYKQKLSIFDPKNSSTYKAVGCNSTPCSELGRGGGCTSQGACQYQYHYGDQSSSVGDLATETLTFGSNTSIGNIVFGCGHQNRGTFKGQGSGLIGLGGGPLSFVSQVSSTVGGKFAYCLTPLGETNMTGKIIFGKDAIVSGPGTVSTPLVKGDPSTFYYLTLESMSIGGETLPFKAGSSFQEGASSGNIIIDSGTTLTFVPDEFFDNLVLALKKAIRAEPVPDPQGLLKLCYSNTVELKVPTITAHFTDADVDLKGSNTFIAVDEETVCLAMLSAESLGQGIAIFGNLSQMDYLVGYDVEEGTVSFKPTDCSKCAE
ncbi:hypothetical protein Ancab_015856 [Ancistrocladus abbreviatus]